MWIGNSCRANRGSSDTGQWTVDSGHLKGTPKWDTERGHRKGTKTLCVWGWVPLPTGGFPFCFSLFAFFFLFFFFLEDNGVHVFAQITVIKEVSSSAS